MQYFSFLQYPCTISARVLLYLNCCKCLKPTMRQINTYT